MPQVAKASLTFGEDIYGDNVNGYSVLGTIGNHSQFYSIQMPTVLGWEHNDESHTSQQKMKGVVLFGNAPQNLEFCSPQIWPYVSGETHETQTPVLNHPNRTRYNSTQYWVRPDNTIFEDTTHLYDEEKSLVEKDHFQRRECHNARWRFTQRQWKFRHLPTDYLI